MKADEKTANATMAVRHVAFLRGINMIGHKLIPMPTLAELFSSLGFRQVKTYLATGNVLFESEESDTRFSVFAHFHPTGWRACDANRI